MLSSFFELVNFRFYSLSYQLYTYSSSSVNAEHPDLDDDISINDVDLNVDTEVAYEYVTVKSWDQVGKSLDRKYFAFVDKIFEDTEDNLTFKISDICLERNRKIPYFKYYDTNLYKQKPRYMTYFTLM